MSTASFSYRTLLTTLLFGAIGASTALADSAPACREVSDCARELIHQHRFTRGPGEMTGEFHWKFTSSWGAESSLHVSFTEEGKELPRGILVYLHGDGPTDGTISTPLDYSGQWPAIKAIAEERNLIAVSVLAPHIVSDTRRTWWENAHSKAKFLTEVMEYLGKMYPLDLDRVVFAGVSGGATLLNGLFVSKFASLYGGGAVSLCGGYLNSIGDMKIDEAYLSRFRVRMVNGDEDFLLNAHGMGAIASNRILKEAGFDSQLEIHEGGYQHCQFNKPLMTVMAEKVDDVLSVDSR